MVDRLFVDNAAWAAGLFEGEGSFTRMGGNRPHASLSMSDEDIVRRFAAVVGCGRVYGPYGPYNSGLGEKPFWAWHATGLERAQWVVVQLWPWLGPRRREAARAMIAAAPAEGPRRTEL